MKAVHTSFQTTSQLDDLQAEEARHARLQLCLTAALARAHGRQQATIRLRSNLRSSTAIAIAAQHGAAHGWELAAAAEEQACQAEEQLLTAHVELDALEQSVRDKVRLRSGCCPPHCCGAISM